MYNYRNLRLYLFLNLGFECTVSWSSYVNSLIELLFLLVLAFLRCFVTPVCNSHLFSYAGGESREQLQGMVLAALFQCGCGLGGHSTDWGALVTGPLGVNSPFYPWPSPARTLLCLFPQSACT